MEISTQSREEKYEVTICTSAKRINLEETAEGTNNRFTLPQHFVSQAQKGILTVTKWKNIREITNDIFKLIQRN